jgi:8-oxo-dGTP pyrophosphatase MutT (NUDIX family)
MIREFSAGVIPYREVNGERKYLLLKSGLTLKELWEFPKGQIEQGEDARSAAIREFQEETGISEVTLDPRFKKVLKYFYRRGGKELVAKTVTYFLGQVKTTRVRISHESTDYEWSNLSEARKFIRHKNVLQLLEEADRYVSRAADEIG